MKRVFFSMLILVAAASSVMAQETSKTLAQGAAVAKDSMMATKIVAGNVQSVNLADAAKGTKSEIVITDVSGKATTILIKTDTTLYDADAKAITLDKIPSNSKVTIAYMTTAEGMNSAKSVKIIK